ncbi:amino acid ABC transporter permease [Chelativorans sp. SCAU2101]|jgi:amine acid ABC transporter, permease protein, 3-TM region, His/Glu/Gln/Arg/opine family|uniref:Amino acid ABC transporter permease n=1 Tax=Chelativorans petroleitrophicus TaxID=2975484 RepID=A0A9X2X8T4_9HYPH|nr:amino acid ABC transporter permease [Chelativorans petroleitrophicus]MCT8990256.1 amino acid ABC transporter permease [Chelativorans petroleitrophicus]
MGYDLDFSVVLSGRYLEMLLSGLATTMLLFVSGWFLGLAIALVLTLIRATPFKPLQWLVAAYVEYHRNVPLLVQLFVWYFGMPQLLPLSVNRFLNQHNAELGFAVIAVSCFMAAYMSEDFRSGLRAVPKAQREAARAMGFSFLQTMRWILIPQAWRIALPALVNQTLHMFKGTSLAGIIGVVELTDVARQIEDNTFRVFEAFGVVTAIYLICTLTLMLGGAALSRRFQLRT